MRKKCRFCWILSFCLFAVFVLSSCASLGPQFQKVETIPEDKGLVYIYRPSSFVGGGVSYEVHADEAVATKLYNGGYYPYYSQTGEIEFWAKTEAKSSVTLDVAPGEIYYIKGTVGVGFLVGRPHLMVVEPNVGEKEIADCKLIQDKDE